MLSYRTRGYNGYACKYSPFYDNKLAVATSANYGLVGNGKLSILSIQDNGQITEDAAFETQDGLFDLAWSELHENQVVTSSGDGSISIFDISLPNYPIKKYQEHNREAFSVYWNLVDKTMFCSSSWDGTIKIWTPSRDHSLMTLTSSKDLSEKVDPIQQQQLNLQKPPLTANKPNLENPTSDCVYQATFSPHDPSILISVNSASHCQIWDIRSPNPLQMDYIAHGGLEILSCDYNKYRSSVIATSSVDKSIKIWDLRMVPDLNQQFLPHGNKIGPSPLNKLIGHDFAVRKVSWSPHSSDTLLSCSYDMTCKVWKDQTDDKAKFLSSNRLYHGHSLVNNFDLHKEFVIGCDWSLWGSGFVASTGWDEMVYVWRAT
ncbi:hypothetical protein CANARDRAFT_5873 [[Candida] arabinofermentans NRRL YB-2248]|uniref:Peroxin-7 n=1 Tax=[Candida] arabinofermentans NRRL YB-2248 TaxID=983967 RepID=A0A1E4T6E6_9ASCO|nr:hypothetical protein CANARDRAFT_5873 [[Candida] arabinofermentans NRRL YB-2248]